ncbi:MAG: hypothetical protein JWL82_299 [Parcubacteria group bacterium]|nr:hypothetical protein [Parcubacteria group bacterium]
MTDVLERLDLTPCFALVEGLNATHVKNVAAVDRAKKMLARREAKLSEGSKALQSARDFIKQPFMTAWANAVARYNLSPCLSLSIEPDYPPVFGFNRSRKKLDVTCQLRYPNGHEPDEDFEGTERDQIQAAFKPLFEEELRKIGLSDFMLIRLNVPSEYFLK